MWQPPGSMFRRRVAALAVLAAGAAGALAAQVWRLTATPDSDLRHAAESKLVSRQWLPTVRGRILDRKGRVLACDRPAFDVAVEYRVLSGEWAVRQAAMGARLLAGPRWSELSPTERQQRIDQFVPLFERHVQAMWHRLAEETGTPLATVIERGEDARRRVERLAESVLRRRLGRELESRLAAGEEITPRLEEELSRRVRAPLAEERRLHVILAGVPDRAGFALRRLAEQTVMLPGFEGFEVPLLPGVRVVDSGAREYPFERVDVDMDRTTLPLPLRAAGTVRIACEGVAFNVIGRMKDRAQADDVQRRRQRLESDPDFRARALLPTAAGELRDIASADESDRGAYRETDPVGASGVEAACEHDLRGLRGLRVLRLETGSEEVIDPVPGRDVCLTLDVMLQARVQAAMTPELGLAIAQPWHRGDHAENETIRDGTPLAGAAVVLDIDSGDVLALVSMPTIPRRMLTEHAAAVFGDALNQAVLVPWIDRAIARPYPPGSVAKVLVLSAAARAGRVDLDAAIECTGHLYPGRAEEYRCWIYKQFQRTHGPVRAVEALMVSCNIYFFTLGQRLGPDGVRRAYEMFGVGMAPGLGIGPEFAGQIGRGPEGRLTPAEAVQLGIGQGPVAWSVLQAADAYATLARGGIRVGPRLIADARTARSAPVDLNLDPRAVREAMDGLRLAVNDPRGTGHHLRVAGVDEPHFAIPGVCVWGKTGTAQAPTITVRSGEPLYDLGVDDPALPAGVRALRRGDHSWFVVLVGREAEQRPRFVIAVLMEYAGSGGRVSGPIVAQIIRALQAEGYL